jgi:GNAT superfamily N-acetyltransferase
MTPRSPLRIQTATPDQAALLTSLAHAAKRHWGYPESWIEAWSAQLTLSPESIAARPTAVACLGDRVAGFYQLAPLGRSLRLDHLWVHPEFLRQGAGTALFTDACRRGAALGWTELRIVSDPHATGFYERQGATRMEVEHDRIEGQLRELPVLLVPLNRAG